MILAQNLRQRLNGNELPYLALIILLFLVSCGPGKKASDVKTVKTPVPVKPEVYNPSTGKYETANPKNTKVDTIHWKESAESPYITDGPLQPNQETNNKKQFYNLVVLMPLSADDLNKDPSAEKTERYFHYYGGLKIGLDALKSKTDNLNISILDLSASPDAIKTTLQKPEIKTADLILGPLRRDHLSATAALAKEKRIVMVAPWNAFRTIENMSDQYVLLKSSLPTHCEVLASYLLKNYKPQEICLIGREKTKAIMNYFQTSRLNALPTSSPFLQTLIKDDYSFGQEFKYLDSTKNVYVVTEFDDPNVVFNFLRHINMMRRDRPITVIGMPSWQDYDADFRSVFGQLNIIISASSFVDNEEPAIQEFRKAFFNQFQNMPLREAFEAYDAIQYLAYMLRTYGNQFQLAGEMDAQAGIATKYRLEKILNTETGQIDDRLKNVQCIENKALFLLQFDQFSFKKIKE